METSYKEWGKSTDIQFQQLKINEECLNQICIDIYDLHGQVTPNVEDKELTIKRTDLTREVTSFISYFMGCIFGRYSLDNGGSELSGVEIDKREYRIFKVDEDNVIPITDDEYFEDDIVSRFIDFVRVTFGQDTLEENLDFIADALIKKINETSRQRIRRDFLKEFYKDHLQTYQKRPIY